jgi:succinate dehydrogenase / fumarate reductase cytochrome b subunit
MHSSIARKNLMAVTGLMLCLFLLVHVLGNVPLLLPATQGRAMFNRYAEVLSGLPPIEVAGVITLASVALHAGLSLVLEKQARAAVGRRPVARPRPATSAWHARFMWATGLLVLLFVGVHLCDFWYPYKYGADALGRDALGQRDLYGLVASMLGASGHAGFYVLSTLAVGVHLQHGVHSALRSLGLHPPGLSRLARGLGTAFAMAVTLAFVAMTAAVFLRQD